MKLTVCSIFRDSASYIDRYFSQMEALNEHVEVSLLLGEGDSTDGTRELLDERRGPSVLIDVTHGGPKYPSVDRPERWDQIAKAVWLTLSMIPHDGHPVMWMEADLIWEPATVLKMLEDLGSVRAVAPRLLALGSTRWYDTWGYRRKGQMFNGQPPYWPPSETEMRSLIPIDSCGSCWVSKDRGQWENWTGHWPFTADGNLWLDPTVTVWHP